MCMIFGYSAGHKADITSSLSSFFSHCRFHPHGWGIAEPSAGRIEKEPVCAEESIRLKEMLEHGVYADSYLAHIRYATIGTIEYENSHPFIQEDISGQKWMLIHNGTIFTGNILDRFFQVQTGDTDSERILLYIVEQMNCKIREEGRTLTAEEKCTILDAVIISLAEGNKLNLLIHDGEILYIHSNMKDTLYIRRESGAVIAASEPLDNKEWQPVVFSTLTAYQKGAEIFRGTMHSYEFIPTPEQMHPIYQMYAGL